MFCLPDIQSIYFKNMFTRLKSSMISSPTFEANKTKSLKKQWLLSNEQMTISHCKSMAWWNNNYYYVPLSILFINTGEFPLRVKPNPAPVPLLICTVLWKSKMTYRLILSNLQKGSCMKYSGGNYIKINLGITQSKQLFCSCEVIHEMFYISNCGFWHNGNDHSLFALFIWKSGVFWHGAHPWYRYDKYKTKEIIDDKKWKETNS